MATSKFAFSLDVDPMPAPRPRARAIKSGAKYIATVYNPSEYTKWATDVATMILAEIPDSAFGAGPLEGPLTVGIIVTVERPKSTKLNAPKPDVDNYAKAVMDAMTKAGVWHDDSQVEFLAVKKQWGPFGQIDVEVTPGVPA